MFKFIRIEQDKRLNFCLISTVDEGNHFAFHKVTENRDRSNLLDVKDMNFSSIGHYPYKTKYDDLGKFSTVYFIVLSTGDLWTKARSVKLRCQLAVKTPKKK